MKSRGDVDLRRRVVRHVVICTVLLCVKFVRHDSWRPSGNLKKDGIVVMISLCLSIHFANFDLRALSNSGMQMRWRTAQD